jgi:hypothetical protein
MASFNNTKGGDIEGQIEHNLNKQFGYRDEGDFSFIPRLTKGEQALIEIYSLINILEDHIEDLLEGGLEDLELDVCEAEDYIAVRERELSRAWRISAEIRTELHHTIEHQLRHCFNVEDLIALQHWIRNNQGGDNPYLVREGRE